MSKKLNSKTHLNFTEKNFRLLVSDYFKRLEELCSVVEYLKLSIKEQYDPVDRLYYSCNECAKLMGKSRYTIARMFKKGVLKGKQGFEFSEDEREKLGIRDLRSIKIQRNSLMEYLENGRKK